MRKLILLSSFVSLALFGCTAPNEGELLESGDTLAAADDTEGKADTASSISFTTFDDDIGSTGTSETRKVFTTASGYKSYFGHKAPSAVDFSKQWVVFYSAGVKNTGGYTASIESISTSKTGLTLKVTTSLTSPGNGCAVTQAITKPFVLATLKKQSTTYVQFYRDDQVHNCTCVQNVLCIMGSHYDHSPGVCKCVPDETCTGHTCPTGSTCTVENGKAICLDPCASVRCAAGTTCKVVGNAVSCVPNGTCASDSDCSLSDNYCGGCACDALGPGETSATCSNPVNCFAQPCGNKVAWCNPVSHKCEARPSTGLACGTNHCAAGEYCCNSSCGMCAKMGVFCIQIACTP